VNVFAAEASQQLWAFSGRQRLVAVGAAAVTALATGLPTDIVTNPFYRRMTPVLWWNYPVWAATAVLAGLVVATYVNRSQVDSSVKTTVGGGFLSFFAVGCPICNKLVVALIGVSGALSFFAPVQPYLAVAGLALLTISLFARLRQLGRCRVPASLPD
jgi:hypothetical protein